MGQFLPPSLATAMEELASTPDAKARNRRAAFRLMKWQSQPLVSTAPAVPQKAAATAGGGGFRDGPTHLHNNLHNTCTIAASRAAKKIVAASRVTIKAASRHACRSFQRARAA